MKNNLKENRKQIEKSFVQRTIFLLYKMVFLKAHISEDGLLTIIEAERSF